MFPGRAVNLFMKQTPGSFLDGLQVRIIRSPGRSVGRTWLRGGIPQTDGIWGCREMDYTSIPKHTGICLTLLRLPPAFTAVLISPVEIGRHGFCPLRKNSWRMVSRLVGGAVIVLADRKGSILNTKTSRLTSNVNSS